MRKVYGDIIFYTEVRVREGFLYVVDRSLNWCFNFRRNLVIFIKSMNIFVRFLYFSL